jgi:hypothetical protein
VSFSTHNWRWGEFRSGTSMLFANRTAPVGWYIDTDNDAMVRIVSSAGGATGGSTAMSDAIGGAAAVSVDSHVLTVAEMPAHTHNVGSAVDDGVLGSGNQYAGSANTPSSSTGGDGGHVHTLSLDVKYVDFMRCTRG